MKQLVAVISYDAGGAEILKYWVQENKYKYDFIYSLGGPALKIFKNKYKFRNTNLEESIKKCDWTITGSGVSNHEYLGIKYSKNNRKFVVTFLDHWINYKSRFIRGNIIQYPDEIWVGDKLALREAKKNFKNKVTVKLKKNPYFSFVKKKASKYIKINRNKKIKILFVSSNIDSVKNIFDKKIHSDKKIFNSFMKNINFLFNNKNINLITLRLHPTENLTKYKHLKNKILIDKNTNLLDTIFKYTHIIGYESMALVVAKLCNKKTFNIDLGMKDFQKIPDKYIDKKIIL